MHSSALSDVLLPILTAAFCSSFEAVAMSGQPGPLVVARPILCWSANTPPYSSIPFCRSSLSAARKVFAEGKTCGDRSCSLMKACSAVASCLTDAYFCNQQYKTCCLPSVLSPSAVKRKSYWSQLDASMLLDCSILHRTDYKTCMEWIWVTYCAIEVKQSNTTSCTICGQSNAKSCTPCGQNLLVYAALHSGMCLSEVSHN